MLEARPMVAACGLGFLRLLPVLSLAICPVAHAASSSVESITAEGFLEVTVEDRPGSARLLYSVLASGERYQLDVPEGVQVGEAGRRVRVRGTRTGRRVAVSEVTAIADGAPGSATSAGSASETTGVQHTLVLMVNFPENPSQPVTAAEARAAVFDAPDSMNAFYREASFEQVSFTGDVVGWLRLPSVGKQCNPFQILNDAVEAADPMVDFRQYERLILLPTTPGVTGCGSADLGTLGKAQIQTAEGTLSISVSWDFIPISGAPPLDPGVMAHEMGHNLGLLHANGLECPTETIDTTCIDTDYGDAFDVMGSGTLLHFNAYHKERLGWLLPANVAAGGEGTYTVQALETPTGAIQAVKVPAPPLSAAMWFYIEHREPVGFDAALTRYPDVLAGTQVRLGCDCQRQSDLLITPATAPFGTIAPDTVFALLGPTPLLLRPLGVGGGHLDLRLQHFELLPLGDRDVAVGDLLALRVPARDLVPRALSISVAGAPAGAALYGLGDVNRDGAVTSADIALLNDLVASGMGTEEQRALADVDGDGSVTPADADLLGLVLAGTRTPLNTAVLLWRPAGTQCGAHEIAFTASEGMLASTQTTTVSVGRPRVVRPLPGATVWGTARIAVETGCPSVDLSVAGGPPEPLPISGTLWDTTGVPDGLSDLRAMVAGGVSQDWQVQVQNQPPFLTLTRGYLKYRGPGLPTKMTLSGTLGFPGVVPTALPQGGAPWLIAFGTSGAFGVAHTFNSLRCNTAGSSCKGELGGIGPAGSGEMTLALSARNGLTRFRVTGRDAATVTALPEGDTLVDVDVCYAAGCVLPRMQFQRSSSTTYSFRKLR